MSFNNDVQQVRAYMDAAERRIANLKSEVAGLEEQHRRLNSDLTTAQIAKIIGKSPKTVYRRLDDGQIKGRRMVDIINYMQER